MQAFQVIILLVEQFGYNQDGNISYCGNFGEITVSNEFAGGITGYSSQSLSTDAISYSYNTGKIKGQSCIGGISGGAWTVGGHSVIFSYIYNTGIITATRGNADCHVGGILGATYYNCYVTNINGANQIKYGYNYGNVVGYSGTVNQVCPIYATVTKVYYVSLRSNSSKYGTAMNASLFNTTTNGSVYYYLNQVKSGVWTINNSYNSGKVILLWQTKI